MITKQQFIDNVMFETGVITHLFDKIPEGGFEYKPTEKQRTTMELLQYLGAVPSIAAQVVQTGDQSLWAKSTEMSAAVTKENFKDMMNGVAKTISEIVTSMSDEQMNEEFEMWGEIMPKSAWMLNLTLKLFVAYKTQLFLYIKSAGNHDINTSNLWRGKDQVMNA